MSNDAPGEKACGPQTKQAERPGTRLAVQRTGSSVTLTIACPTEYQAIELYDRLVEGARDGQLNLQLKAT